LTHLPAAWLPVQLFANQLAHDLVNELRDRPAQLLPDDLVEGGCHDP
jgi:hypothetical protein